MRNIKVSGFELYLYIMITFEMTLSFAFNLLGVLAIEYSILVKVLIAHIFGELYAALTIFFFALVRKYI